jgi:hypothetical protein
MPLQVIFVLLITIFAPLTPLPISAVYQSHTGPHVVLANLTVGGGVGPILSPAFQSDGIVGGGIAAGRGLINARTISGAPTPIASFVPFIPQNTIHDVWSAQVPTVVVRRALDCGAFAPQRVWDSSGSIVAIDPIYFSPSLVAQAAVSFAMQPLGYISNDPHITTVYLNASTAVAPGLVETQSTVIFLAANGTMEGAQQRIISTTSSSRIAYVDVLVCTSAVQLEISQCNIEQGTFSNCSLVEATNLPKNALTSATGGVEFYIKNPISTSIALSAAPVMACHQLSNRLPMWNYITEELLASQLPPLSFLSQDIPIAPPYDIPLSYVSNALFGQTVQALVQGMTTVWQVYSIQSVQLTAEFATSNHILLYTITVAVVVCALIAAWGHRTTRTNSELDVTQIAYLTRTGRLGQAFQDHVKDSGRELKESVLRLGVRFDKNNHQLEHDAVWTVCPCFYSSFSSVNLLQGVM